VGKATRSDKWWISPFNFLVYKRGWTGKKMMVAFMSEVLYKVALFLVVCVPVIEGVK